MPESITSDYPDIAHRTLYIEYATKIITGEYSIDKFDEFVEKWYATGGTEVTEKAREWYAKKAQVYSGRRSGVLRVYISGTPL
jgi:hypothetical protein